MSVLKIRNASDTGWIILGGGVDVIQQDAEPGSPFPGMLWLDTDGAGGVDADALHDNESGEIAAITEKTIGNVVNNDLLLIEDSEASNAKKKVKVGSLITTDDFKREQQIRGVKYNLLVNYGGSANNQVACTCSYLELRNVLGHKMLVESISLPTIDITVSGANGLDTGSEASSTLYYIFVIYNPTTSTKAGLLSLSSYNPVLPSGYEYYRRVGEIYNASNGNFHYMNRCGDYVFFYTPAVIYSSQSLTSTWTQFNFPEYLPSGISSVADHLLLMTGTTTSSTGNLQCISWYAGNAFAWEVNRYYGSGGSQARGVYQSQINPHWHRKCNYIYAKTNNGTSTVNNQDCRIFGYYLPV